MQALREIIHLDGDQLRLNIKVPAGFAGKDVEVLVVPLETPRPGALTSPIQQRIFGAFKDKIEMADDFDDELPEGFWSDQ